MGRGGARGRLGGAVWFPSTPLPTLSYMVTLVRLNSFHRRSEALSAEQFVEEVHDGNGNTLLGQYIVYSSSKEGVAYEVS